jgi:hypothetical protein
MFEWLWSALGFVGTQAVKRIVDRGVDRATSKSEALPRLVATREFQEVPARSAYGPVRQSFGRIRVTALGRGTIRDVRGFLCSIERLSEGRPVKKVFSEPFPLIWSYDEQIDTRDIVEGVPHLLDVVMCQEGMSALSPRIRNSVGYVEPTVLSDDPLASGEYRFSARVTSGDGQSVPVELDFEFRDTVWPGLVPISCWH